MIEYPPLGSPASWNRPSGSWTSRTTAPGSAGKRVSRRATIVKSGTGAPVAPSTTRPDSWVLAASGPAAIRGGPPGSESGREPAPAPASSRVGMPTPEPFTPEGPPSKLVFPRRTPPRRSARRSTPSPLAPPARDALHQLRLRPQSRATRRARGPPRVANGARTGTRRRASPTIGKALRGTRRGRGRAGTRDAGDAKCCIRGSSCGSRQLFSAPLREQLEYPCERHARAGQKRFRRLRGFVRSLRDLVHGQLVDILWRSGHRDSWWGATRGWPPRGPSSPSAGAPRRGIGSRSTFERIASISRRTRRGCPRSSGPGDGGGARGSYSWQSRKAKSGSWNALEVAEVAYAVVRVSWTTVSARSRLQPTR